MNIQRIMNITVLIFLCVGVMEDSAVALPPVTTNLVLQLNADDVTTVVDGDRILVSQWNDQSGNGNHAIQTDPANMPEVVTDPFSSAIILRFDDPDDHMLIGDPNNPPSNTLNPGTGGFTVMIAGIVRRKDDSAEFLIRKGNLGSFYEGWSVWHQNVGPDPKLCGRVNSEGIDDNAHKGGQRQNAELEKMFIFFSVLDGTEGFAYYQGTNEGAEDLHTDNGYLGGISTDEAVRIAQNLNDAEIAEILIYNRQLSESELEDVGIYLAGKYYVGTGTNYPVETCGQLWGNGDAVPADFNHNCKVDLADLVMLAGRWLYNYDPAQN